MTHILSKQEVLDLEENPDLTRIHCVFWNTIFKTLRFKLTRRHPIEKKFSDIHHAPFAHNIPDSLWKRVRFHSERLGGKPSCFRTLGFGYRTASWGVKTKNNQFIINYSTRGFTVYVDKNLDTEAVEEIINWIYERICLNKT